MPDGLTMLRSLLLWWARQLLALVPRRWRSDAIVADGLVVSVDGGRDGSEFDLILRRRRLETWLGRFRMDVAGERAARAALGKRPRRVILRPGPNAVLQRNVVLPLAAESEISRVLRYEMDRLTPFTADQVFWSATVQRRDRATGRLEVLLTLSPKALLQPVLAALHRIGVAPTAIEGNEPRRAAAD